MMTVKIYSQKVLLIIVVTILILSGFISVLAQKTSPAVTISPTMKVSNLKTQEENPMRLDVLNVDVKVLGQIAVTTLDMTYYNNNNRVMEGEFNFPLAEGQTVTRFALDINGAMREGVVVEKEKGRKTFESVVRRGVDPGLLEKTEGNNFRARVYPLPAKGSRRIIIAFEQELTNKGENDLYILPLLINEAVSKFSFHAEVIKNTVRFDSQNNELTNLSFKKWNDSYVADYEQLNYIPNKQIALNFPHTGDSATIFTAAKNTGSDSSYFMINLRPQLVEKAKTLPKNITILWDNSNSAQERDMNKELKILEAYIEKIETLSADLVFFNIKLEKPIKFNITNGNCDKLIDAIKATQYDGATCLGNLDFLKYNSDEVLLFTDGLSTFGTSEPKFFNTPVYTINSNPVTNHSVLTFIAQSSGGTYVNLSKLTVNESLTLLTNSDFHFISAKIISGKVSNVYPSGPCQFSNSFSMAGIIKGKTATLQLNFGFGSTVVYSKQIEIKTDNVDETALLRRFWAEKKLAELSYNEEKNKDEITQTGKEFGIVTSNTSLIVLETLADYLQYEIVPPKEMQEEYNRLVINSHKNEENTIKNRIDYILNMSEEQSKWWNTNYPLENKKPMNLDKSGGSQARFAAPTVVDTVQEEVILEESMNNVVLEDNDAAYVVVEERASEDRRDTRDHAPAVEREVLADAVMMMVEENASPPETLEDVSTNEAASFQKAKKLNGELKADIQLNAWDPQTPYLKVLQYTTKGQEYQTYLKLKAEYGTTPAFYIDASDFFVKIGSLDTAVKIISNLAELKLEAPQLLRVLGEKLVQLKQYQEAVTVYEKVLKLKGEEPQSYRDLGLAYSANGNPQQAIKTLYEVITTNWDGRFPEIELIVLNEINNIIAQNPKVDYSFIDKRLIKKEPVDIRVVLSWDTDNCDMDLWVTDPSTEKCFYQNKLTHYGGKISNDFTSGYGPEEYMMKNALSGEYVIQTNYYGTRAQTQLTPVTLHLAFYTNYGKPNQEMQDVTIRLENQKDVIDIGKFSFKVK